MGKIWEDIKGREGRYQISNNGLVKSVRRIDYRSTHIRVIKERILKTLISKNGYERINLKDEYGNGSMFSVHRLVAKAFITNPKNKKTVNHKNGIKTDNRVSNLEWNTQKENRHHAMKTGLWDCRGEKHGRAKITKKDVIEIRAIGTKETSRDLSKKYGVTFSLICKIRNKQLWQHI